MIVVGILAFSILLQFSPAVLALSLMRLTGRRLAWILLSAAILLMAGRRCITFVEILQDPTFVHQAHLLPELFSLLTSVLMVGGLATIGSVFEEQQRDKKEAQESEMRFRQLAENIREVFWLMDWSDQTIIYVSPAYEVIWGRPTQDLRVNPLYLAEGVHPEDCQRLKPLSRERLENGTWDTEFRVVSPDGTVRWVHDRAFPIREENGQIHRIAGIAEDITERKRIEEDLRLRHMEQKAFSRIILETTTHLDRHIILQSALEGALDLTGLEGGTICVVDHKIGTLNLAAHKNISEAVIHDITTHEIKIGECLCGNVAKTDELLILWDNASGSEFATRESTRNEGIRFHAAFPLVTKGEVIGVLCIFARSNTTPSRRSLDLVRDLCGPVGCAIENASLYEAEHTSREYFNRIIESITDGFVAIDRKGCFTYVNQRAAEMMGLPLEDLIGKPCWPEFPVPLCDSLYDPCKQALAEQEPRHLEEHLLEKQRWLDIRIYPSPDGLAIYFQDITELKESLEELRKSHEHLEATFNALPDLLFEVDQAGRILDYRAQAVELLYVPPEEFLGKTFHEVLPEEARGIVAAAIEEARTRGSHRGAVYCLKTSAGLAWFELSVAVKGDLEGPDMRFIVLVRDITKRRQAEEALRESESRFRELAENIREVFWVFDWTNKKVLYASPAYEQVLGRPRQALYEDYGEWAQSIHPDDLEYALASFS